MAVSKRLRYEVLRRDNHACRYCGAVAPDVPLTVDHVVPTTLGGSDDPTNLVTACRDCNAGKSASAPDAPIVADVTEAAIRWGRAVELAAQSMSFELEGRRLYRQEFLDKWNSWQYGPADDRKTVDLDTSWPETIDALLARGLTFAVIFECVDVAMRRQQVGPDQTFRYFCGVAWRKVDEMTDVAKAVYDSWEAED